MNKIAKFEKVSLEEFTKAMKELYPKYTFGENEIEIMWKNIMLPVRATKQSAGYDFFAPFEFILRPGCAVTIPTGIRVKIDDGYAMALIPKSGIGVKSSTRLSNTIGLIDADYYNSDNEGHIMVRMEMPVEPTSKLIPKMTGQGNLYGVDTQVVRKNLKISADQKFVQGVFIPFGITTDDDETEKEDRNGGFGSTGETKPPVKEPTSGDPSKDPNAEPISNEDIAAILND